MAHNELESFVLKFKNLCLAGFEATLTFEAVNGQASVLFKSSLGVLQPNQVPGYHSHAVKKGVKLLG